MPFVLKCPDALAQQNLDVLRSLEPHVLIEKAVVGLAGALLRAVPAEMVLPEEICRLIGPGWQDPTFRKQLREAAERLTAAALGAHLPGPLANRMAAYLVEALFPGILALGDRLLQRFCPSSCSSPVEERAVRP